MNKHSLLSNYKILPALLWAVFICASSLTESRNLPSFHFPHLDKIVHFTFYFVLVNLLFWGSKKLSTHFIIVMLGCFTYSFLIEISQQLFTSSRTFEILDLAANLTGITFGVVFYKSIKQVR